MALPPEIGDREHQKFVETDFGSVAVRTQNAYQNGLSVANSTTDELGASEVFTGTWTDVNSYPSVLVSAQVDVPGGTVIMEWSDTGTGAAEYQERFVIMDGVTRTERSTVKKRYYRTVYDNVPNQQGHFSLNTFFGDIPAPVNGTIGIGDSEDNPVAIRKENRIYVMETHDSVAHNVLEDILVEMKKHTELLTQILE